MYKKVLKSGEWNGTSHRDWMLSYHSDDEEIIIYGDQPWIEEIDWASESSSRWVFSVGDAEYTDTDGDIEVDTLASWSEENQWRIAECLARAGMPV